MSETEEKPAEADATVYRLRANAFVKPRLYRLTGNALTWEEEGEKLDGVFYDDICEQPSTPCRWDLTITYTRWQDTR
jgi:hypothetical protein